MKVFKVIILLFIYLPPPFLIHALKYYYREVKDQYVLWDYLQHTDDDVAWVNVYYCSARFQVGDCDNQLSLDTILQLSHPDKAFFIQMDGDCVAYSSDLAAIFELNKNSDWNFFAIPMVRGPGGKNINYDPQQPEFVQASGHLTACFNEIPDAGESYTREMLDQYHLYIGQYIDSGLTVYALFDAYYLTITTENITDIFADMPTMITIIYDINGKRRPDPATLKMIYNKLREKREKVILFLDEELTSKMQSYLPTVSWIHAPYDRQGKFKDIDDFFRFMRSPNQLIELDVIKCGEVLSTVTDSCTEKLRISVDQVLQKLDMQVLVLLYYNDTDFMMQEDFSEYPSRTVLVIEVGNGPNSNVHGNVVSVVE